MIFSWKLSKYLVFKVCTTSTESKILSWVPPDWEPRMTVLARTLRKFTRPIDRSTRFRAKVWTLVLPHKKHSANHSTARNGELVYSITRQMRWKNNWMEWPSINGWSEGRFKDQESSMCDVSSVIWYMVLKKPILRSETLLLEKTTNVPVNLFISYKHFLSFHGIISGVQSARSLDLPHRSHKDTEQSTNKFLQHSMA
jgi:hypothetical protein